MSVSATLAFDGTRWMMVVGFEDGPATVEAMEPCVRWRLKFLMDCKDFGEEGILMAVMLLARPG